MLGTGCLLLCSQVQLMNKRQSVVMLNLFQHLNSKILNQVQDDDSILSCYHVKIYNKVIASNFILSTPFFAESSEFQTQEYTDRYRRRIPRHQILPDGDRHVNHHLPIP